MPYRLPPVLHSVVTAPRIHGICDPLCTGGATVQYYDSGTSALAAVLKAARQARNLANPEVIFAGYTCPDVISAALYAGVKPVLVDFEQDRPWLDLDETRAALCPRTIAIVAINFLGISERVGPLRAMIDSQEIFLIEDCAQAYPLYDDSPLTADARLHSFGRGKPVNLLGGGALRVRNELLLRNLDSGGIDQASFGEEILFQFKATIFNWLMLPRIYGIVAVMPFLNIGETRYHILEHVGRLAYAQKRVMNANLEGYRDSVPVRQFLVQMFNDGLSDLSGMVPLPAVCGGDGPLLRYPVLFPDRARRDLAYDRLDAAGYGASRLYETVLSDVRDVPIDNIEVRSSLKNARSFAGRLLTLPVHTLAENHAEAILEVISAQY